MIMLAGKVDLTKLEYPCLVGEKIDGIRAVVRDGQFISRSGKPIPNLYVQSKVTPSMEGLDGELVVGPANANDVFRVTTSAIMRQEGEPDFTFKVFDEVSEYSFLCRHYRIFSRVLPTYVCGINQWLVKNEEDLMLWNQIHLAAGYEGTMIRSVFGVYKNGRSTVKEGYLLKLKEWHDSEAIVLAVFEQEKNTNPATIGFSGHIERSSHLEGKVGKNTLGGLVVRDISSGQEFSIGTGFDEITRQSIWDDKDAVLGKIVRYKYMRVGMKEKPRFPVFQGFRDILDLDSSLNLPFNIIPVK